MDDMELLREWVRRGSEDAFRSLVDRHINLVYSTARRLLFNSHEAEEVTQTVFILLARKANNLSGQTVLAGWLYRATGYAAAQMLRAEGRRRHRLETLSNMDSIQADSVWERIQPLLEEAMSRLGQADRDAVVLRFMEGKSLQEVGQALGLSEDAARKRVHRAVEKLKAIFGRRGVATTSALLTTALSASAMPTVPAGLGASVAAAAIGKGVILATSTSTLVKGTLTLMTWTKIKIATLAVAALVLGGATTVIVSRKMTAVAVEETPATNPGPAIANGGGRLGGPGNRPPDWRAALAQAHSPGEKEQIERFWCVDNLKQVGGAAREWALTHDSVFPGDVFVLKTQIAPRYLTCPSDPGKTEAGTWAVTTTANVSYVLVSPSIKDTRPNLVVIRCPVHGHVALSDGSVLQGNIVAKLGMNSDNTMR